MGKVTALSWPLAPVLFALQWSCTGLPLKAKANELIFLKMNSHVNKLWKMNINGANVNGTKNYQTQNKQNHEPH